jgi:hypothetical protein
MSTFTGCRAFNMIRYFTNRQLSRSFGVNLAKWKRWSREFLPPDPLGGLQSGYARQYSPDDAFQLRVAGYLVSAAALAIPDVRRVLEDLGPLMQDAGFRFDPAASDGEKASRREEGAAGDIQVWIHRGAATAMHYRIQMIEKRMQLGGEGRSRRLEQRWLEELVPERAQWPRQLLEGYGARILPLSSLLREFVDALVLPSVSFPYLRKHPEGFFHSYPE